MRALLVLVMLLVAGCAAPALPGPEGGTPTAPDAARPFLSPVKVNGAEHAYEPSIEVRDDGALFITAAPYGQDRGAQLSSWLWRSLDAGATWEALPSPADAQRRLPALEGEIALDAAGRLYFVDTNGADMTFSRWSAEGDWEASAPLPTPFVDDRPWLEAAGDGLLYLLVNNAAPAPDPRQGAAQARIWLLLSRDGGDSWDLSTSFPDSLWCTGAARAERALVLCSRMHGTFLFGYTGLVNALDVVLYESRDAGASWQERDVWPTGFRFDANMMPSVALGHDGRALLAWVDGDWTRLLSARETDAGWLVEDVPVPGKLGKIWACAGGAMAIAYYAEGPGGWLAHAATHDGAGWRTHLLDVEPVAVGPDPPGDFLQCDVDAAGIVHVAYHREPLHGLAESGTGRPGDVFYVRSSESFAARSA